MTLSIQRERRARYDHPAPGRWKRLEQGIEVGCPRCGGVVHLEGESVDALGHSSKMKCTHIGCNFSDAVFLLDWWKTPEELFKEDHPEPPRDRNRLKLYPPGYRFHKPEGDIEQ